jgi:hypothetical protein
MNIRHERRLLQIVVAAACLVPLSIGGISVVEGPAWLMDGAIPPRDLDSHFRYISGIFLGVGIAFATCIPAIEARGARFRLLSALVVSGGLARLVSLIAVGAPSQGHLLGLGMELVVVPLLVAWQHGLARRWSRRI